MKKYVVHSGYRKSKPVTAERIQQRYADGDISEDATVQRVGTTFRVPIFAFLQDATTPTPIVVQPVTRRRRRRRIPPVVVLTGMLLIVGAGVLWLSPELWQSPKPEPAAVQGAPAVAPVVPPAAAVSPELQLVRDYLRNNLDSGEWEEVQTFPAKPITRDGWKGIWA